MINGFFGEYRYLSNFWYATINFESPFGSYSAKTVEHAYQASKADNKNDFEAILLESSPKEAKRLGKTVSLRSDFDRIETMQSLIEIKFDQNIDLAIKLADTDCQELVEANTWGDVFFGKCKGVGENHLGRILMDKRDGVQDMLDDIITDQAKEAAVHTCGIKMANNPYGDDSPFRKRVWENAYGRAFFKNNC